MNIFLKYLEVSQLNIILLTLCVVRTFCFNIKTDYFVTHRGPFDSAFGFSLAQHKDADGYWVLVGAPEAETPNFGVSKGGAVYKCHTSYEDLCDRIPFDTKGNHHDGSQYIDDKSHQWFGASVVSRSGIAVACAPRYVWYSVKKNRREPIGKCFVLTNQRGSARFKEYSPCMTNAWGYHRQGNCQAGFGVALSQGGTRLYVGAVGSWYWQGQVFYQNLLNMQEKLTTSEAPKQFDMSYMGFSLCMGNFDGDTEEDVAVGVPRGSSLKGMVVLFNHKLEVLYNITGDQIGSYFGYSIAVLDYDGDGLEDVAVGAPWHTQIGNPSLLYEEGSVSLFKHTLQHNFRRTQKLYGRRSRSHFGLSLTSLKDLNGDGYEDLAVGAPRDGEYQKGGVYIFLGGPSGLIEKPAQIIYAEDLAKPSINSFGWALSGGLDLDQNEYPDLAVGAHESNNVIIFRTRPIVSVEASVKIKSESGVFDLESLSCSLQNNTDVPCYPVHYCFSYTGKGVPPQISLFYSLQLDTASGEHLSRLFFLRNEGQATFNSSILLHKDVSKCKSQYIYAAPFLHDKLTPLVSKLFFSLDPVTDSGDSLSYDSADLRPVLAPPPFGQESFVKDIIYFQNNCGDDNICIPNLRSRISIDESNYVLGSRKNIILNTRVFNKGEDSYGTRAYIEIPSGVHFNKFIVTYNGAQNDVTPFCTTSMKVSYSTTERDKGDSGDENEEGNNGDNDQENETDFKAIIKNGTSNIICELGNPLPSETAIGLQLHFQPSSQIMSFPYLKFDFKSKSTNDERNSTLRDNTASVSLPVVMESDVNIRGISWPDTDFNYNASSFGKGLLGTNNPIRHEKEAGPEVTHIYDVVNRGPSDLPNVQLYPLWPTRTLVGDPLLYLTETPVVSPNSIRCESVSDVNYLDLKIDSPSKEPLANVNFLKSEKWKSRQKRRLSEEEEEEKIEILLNNQDSKPNIKSNKFQELLSCGSTNCTVMKCFTPLLKAKDNFIVRVRSRLWVNTIEKLGISDLKISSRLVVHSTANWKTTDEDDRTWSENVVSAIKTRAEAPTSSLPWLIWLGSTLVGLLVLALLILLLWMLGFFKRRRPRDESENELINRNGTNSRH